MDCSLAPIVKLHGMGLQTNKNSCSWYGLFNREEVILNCGDCLEAPINPLPHYKYLAGLLHHNSTQSIRVAGSGNAPLRTGPGGIAMETASHTTVRGERDVPLVFCIGEQKDLAQIRISPFVVTHLLLSFSPPSFFSLCLCGIFPPRGIPVLPVSRRHCFFLFFFPWKGANGTWLSTQNQEGKK